MKFFPIKDYMRSWSVWAMSALTSIAAIDLSTTWVDQLLPEQYKPIIYAVLGAVAMVARAVKQTNLSK